MKKPDPILPHPLPDHPRLLASSADWLRLRRQVQSDEVSARIFASLKERADLLFSSPPLERVMDGYRLLAVSRMALSRISTLGVVFRVTKDSRYASRALAEMTAIARFSDWNPSHFLDTAEMSLSLAIGYDWLYDQLTAEEREEMAIALLEKGLKPSLAEPRQWFISGNNNWNQVCHAGMTAAAISVADRDPLLADQILRRAVDNLHHAASAYAPDGAYPEGPTYWNYGTSFHVVMAAALERLTGSTHGVEDYPGFTASADYINQVTTPSGDFYAYADGGRFRPMLVPLFWLARRFGRPDWLRLDLKKLEEHLNMVEGPSHDYNRLLALALLWRDPNLISSLGYAEACHWMAEGTMPVAVHRTAFDDPNALYAAIKGGSPSLNHAHMDVGSFILEADGQSWAVDLGAQQYESLESIGVNLWDASENGARWTIFRFGPDSHNILRFNGGRQLLNASAPFVRFNGKGERPHSVLDLSALYAGQVQSVFRGIMMLENRAVLIQDEWCVGDQDSTVTWQLLVTAEVLVHGRQIILRQAGKEFVLEVLDSNPVMIEVCESSVLEKVYDAPNPGLKRISISSFTPAGQKGALRILAMKTAEAPVSSVPFEFLESWSAPEIKSPRTL